MLRQSYCQHERTYKKSPISSLLIRLSVIMFQFDSHYQTGLFIFDLSKLHHNEWNELLTDQTDEQQIPLHLGRKEKFWITLMNELFFTKNKLNKKYKLCKDSSFRLKENNCLPLPWKDVWTKLTKLCLRGAFILIFLMKEGFHTEKMMCWYIIMRTHTEKYTFPNMLPKKKKRQMRCKYVLQCATLLSVWPEMTSGCSKIRNFKKKKKCQSETLLRKQRAVKLSLTNFDKEASYVCEAAVVQMFWKD